MVGHNHLQSLPPLQEHIPLEVLDLQHNLLTKLPETLFVKALKWVSVSNIFCPHFPLECMGWKWHLCDCPCKVPFAWDNEVCPWWGGYSGAIREAIKLIWRNQSMLLYNYRKTEAPRRTLSLKVVISSSAKKRSQSKDSGHLRATRETLYKWTVSPNCIHTGVCPSLKKPFLK